MALTDDTVDEPDETFTVTLSQPAGAAVSPTAGEATGKIIDNDDPPVLSINGGQGVEGGEAVFTLALAGESGSRVSVGYRTVDGTAVGSADYAAASGELTWEPGAQGTAREIRVALLADDVDEPDETFTMKLEGAVGASVPQPEAEGRILDITDPPVASIAGAAGEEGDEVVFAVSLVGTGSRPVTMAYETVDREATAGSDYRARSGELTFAPGETTAGIAVRLLDDAVEEPDESFVVRLTGAQFATIGQADGIGRIVDNDEPPEVSIVDAGTAVEGAPLSFRVDLSGLSARSIQAEYRTVAGTAMPGDDYVADRGVVAFAPGETTRTIEVATLDDAIDEANETLSVRLVDVHGARVQRRQALGTIADNDAPPSLAIRGGVGLEGGAISFVVELDGASSLPVTVEYATRDDSALQGDDYHAATGVLEFDAFETHRTINVDLVDDQAEEPDETFALTLDSPTNAELAQATATGTIIDDDGTVVVSIAGQSAAEGDAVEFRVSVAGTAHDVLVVDFATADGTARAGADYEATEGTLTFAVGEDVHLARIPTLADALDEPDEWFSVTLSPSSESAQTATVAIASADGTIIDANTAPTLSISGGPWCRRRGCRVHRCTERAERSAGAGALPDLRRQRTVGFRLRLHQRPAGSCAR